MPEYDVTVRVRKQFIVRARDEQHAISMARLLMLDGPEDVTADDLDIDVDKIELAHWERQF